MLCKRRKTPNSWKSDRASLLAIGLALVLAFGLSGCNRSESSVQIKNVGEYEQTLQAVFELSKNPLAAVEQGEPLGDAELKNLEQAEKLTQGLVDFRPTVFTLYSLLGKIQLARGDNVNALQNLQQAVRLAPKVTDIEIIIATADAYRWLAEAWLRSGDPKAAEGAAREALKRVAQNPDYAVMVASTLVQQKKFLEAKKMIDQALKSSPGHYPSLRLKKFIEKSEAESPTP